MTRPLVVAAVMTLAATAGAQEPADTAVQIAVDSTRLASDSLLLAGQPVRGVYSDGTRFHAVVRAVRGDTLVLRKATADGQAVRVPVGTLRRLEVRRDRRAAGVNMAIGALLGGIGGGLVYLNACDKHPSVCVQPRPEPRWDDEEDDSWNNADIMIFGGAVLGAGLGYLVTPSSWRRVGISLEGSVSPAPDGGVSAAVGARFPLTMRARGR